MKLLDQTYTAKDFNENTRVRIEHGNDTVGWERLSQCRVINREKTFDDGQKVVVEGITPEGDTVREVTNLEARGKDKVIKIVTNE